MKRHEAEKIGHALNSAIVNALNRFVDPAEGNGQRETVKGMKPDFGPPPPTSMAPAEGFDFERIYRQIKNRLIDELKVDPVFVKLLASVPELEVEISPRVISLDNSSTRGRTGLLIVRGWFDEPKTVGATRKELARTGTDPGGGGALYDVLKNFVRDGLLTIEGEGYQKAPGLKVSERRIEA